MLRRFDENGNGMLEPDETNGRGRFLIERFARDVPGIDLNRPISIDRLARGMERARESSRGGSSDSNSSRSSSSSSSRGSSRSSTVPDPLVPGFEILDEFTPPLAFGVRDESENISVSDADLREAEDRMRRYDENRDGFLDRQEISRNRWSDDPFAFDQNRDGRISSRELALRYGRRWR
jgi:hypothetical protein